jgi:hypothetical protein
MHQEILMSIFSKIRDKIFGRKAPPAPRAPSPPSPTAPPATTAAPPVMDEVDVEAILSEMADSNAQKLNWRTSIVDLMKLLGMESSLAERRELATELGYTGDQQDTATMNMWLHRQVMRKLAENGGKVPASMLD